MAKRCDAEMRHGRCRLDPGHTGAHSTVAFSCDGCGKRRRGRPTFVGRDGEYERGIQLCYLCANGKT